MKYFLKTICILVLINMVFPAFVFAQSISVVKNPPFPKEGEQVILSISAFGFDVKNSLITWKEGEKILLQGIGLSEYTVPSAQGQMIVVTMVDQKNSQQFVQAIPITTSNVDLLWEAIGSYTPPFYKGKALPAIEANINVVAIPDHGNLSALSYSWEKEYTRQAAQSGRGKNSFSFLANPLEQANSVSVEVSSADQSFSGAEDVVIRYGNSEVLFYEESPELGTLFNKSLKNGHFVGEDKEITLTAVPFFVTADSIASKALEMIWKINGSSLPVQSIKNKVRLSGERGISGNVRASIFINNNSRIFEEGTVGLELNF